MLANGQKCTADHSPYLCGTNVEYCMQTVDSGGWVMKQGQVYEIKLVSNSGEVYTITAYGVESIADCSREILVDQSLKKLIPVPALVW